MKALVVFGMLLIIVQVAVLILLHKRRQRFRQEREKFLAEFDSSEDKHAAPPHNNDEAGKQPKKGES